MEFNFTQEQKDLQREIIDFARNFLNDKDKLECFSKEMWEKVSDFGLFALNISEEYGGLGESYLTAALAYEALGYACKNNGFVFTINNHVWVAQNLLYQYGSKELKNKYLPQMINGKRIGAICITEQESGSDAFSMTTSATKDGDDYILNGSKMYISNGPIADIFIVICVTREKPIKQYTAFVVEKEFDGFTKGKEIEKMGLGACPTCEIVLNNVRVPKENILGRLNMGSLLLTQAIEWERCYEFAPHVGAIQRVMEMCIEQVNCREQFGKPIKEYQAVSHKISNMKIAIEMSKLMLYKIAWIKDQGKSAYLETSIFKTYVSENYIQTCKDAMQIFGCYGYSKEYDCEREIRDALACSIYSGTNEMQRNTIFNVVSTEI